MIRLFFLAAAAASLAACQTVPAGRRGYDPGRLTSERMSAMVERPIAQVEGGDLAAGIVTFDAMLAAAEARRGPHSLAAADLLTAFGARLHAAGTVGEDHSLSERALLYLRRATDAYRAIFGPDHPEVATALNTWADVERYLRPHAPAAAEAALDEAYRIRRAALGPSHKETLWTMIYLAQTRNRLAWTRNEPARIAQVSGDLLEAVELSRASDAETALEMPVVAQLQRARLYARHRRAASALAAFAAARADVRRTTSYETCRMVVDGGGELEGMLGTQGLNSKLAELRREIAAEAVRCEAFAPASDD